MNYNCQCPQEIKTGQTSAMCCNICGKPDDPMWVISENVDKSFPPKKEKQMTVIDYKKISDELECWYWKTFPPTVKEVEDDLKKLGYKIVKI
jgi:hypothetical protein